MPENNANALIEIRHLGKTFGDHVVLKDIDFTVKHGDVTCIIGASGSGKSTLLRCLNLFETPTSGEILFEGVNVLDNVKPSEYRKRVGMVFQSFNLFKNMNVLKNCTVGPVKVLKLSKEEAIARALKYLGLVGMAEYADARPSQLSGGQKQRVAIARALVLSPKILCFDEPTSALAPMLTGEVLKVIKSLRDEGRTMIIVTHEMDFAKNVSDKIAFMSEGVVAEYGTPDEVFNNSSSEELRRFLAAEKKEEINE